MRKPVNVRSFLNRKTALIVGAGAAIVALSGTAAFAYWTTTGSGTGSATTATSNGTIVLHASFADGLTPGASTPVSFTADNAGSSSLFVGTIHLASVTADAGHASCDVADYTMADVTSDTTAAAGATGATLNGTGTLTFADTAVNQDSCKGATITLHLSSN
jgi:hypothetical protein